MKFTAKQYSRMKVMQLEISTQNAQLADIVYDKQKSLSLIRQLIELRQLMSSFGVKSKEDLEWFLEKYVERS